MVSPSIYACTYLVNFVSFRVCSIFVPNLQYHISVFESETSHYPIISESIEKIWYMIC
jgi:hypothetical protein